MSEKPADKIKNLKTQLASLEEQIRKCEHKFSEPRTIQIEYDELLFSHYEPHGSDPEPIYNTIKKYRSAWERECERCGYKEQTEKTEPIIKGYTPKFSKQ